MTNNGPKAEEKLRMRGAPLHSESLLKELEAQRADIDNAMAKLKTQMGSQLPTSREERVLSPVTKQRISETMKRYWAKRKKRQKPSAVRANVSGLPSDFLVAPARTSRDGAG